MRAQLTKNAMIVPAGAKGGFIIKRGDDRRRSRSRTSPTSARCSTSPTTWSTARSCTPSACACATATTPTWSSPPTRARRRSPTPRTASPHEYGFWLDDAFASGGSAGYDHKALGITARGAWESVKRHFRSSGSTQARRVHGRRHRRHVRRRVRQRDAALGQDPAARRPTTTGTCSSTPIPDAAAVVRRAPAAVRAGRLLVGRLRPRADLRGRRRLPRATRSRSRSPTAGARGARGRRGARCRRPRSSARSCARRSTCCGTAASAPSSRPRPETDADAADRSQRRDPRRRATSCAARVVGEGGNLGFTRRARVEYAAGGGRDQRRLHRQLGGRRLLRPRGQPEDPARPRRAPRRADPRRARRAAARRSPRTSSRTCSTTRSCRRRSSPRRSSARPRGCSPTRT